MPTARAPSLVPSASHAEPMFFGVPWCLLAGIARLLLFPLLTGLVLTRTDALLLLLPPSPPFSIRSFCFVAYCCNLLPYLGVTRQAFIYHYMPALHYASLMAAVVVEMVVPARLRGPVVAVVVAAAVLNFLWMAPWIYGWPISHDAHAARRLLSTWD
jgi:dolichyl-phosphate-mannose--protein O-mannosyl transferase